MVETLEDPANVVIGLIDPSTGSYSRYVSFSVASGGVPTFGGLHAGGDNELSPDMKRYGVGKTINNLSKAGWVDEHGNFTDVTTDIQPASDFGGAPRVGAPIGFDIDGAFYYSENDAGNTNLVVYKLPPGQTTGAQEIMRKQNAADMGFVERDGTGHFGASVSACAGSGQWLNPSEYVTSTGSQIVRVPVAASSSSNCTGSANNNLLPETNTSVVQNPVVSPDKQRVAFVRNLEQIYIVPSSGGVPVKIPPSPGISFAAGAALIGWK
jgi:hypothetical protein